MERRAAFRLPSDQILTLVCLVMSGSAFLSLGRFPGRVLSGNVFGSELSLPFGLRGLCALLLVGLTALGMDGLVRRVAHESDMDLRYSSSFWVLPGLVTLSAVSVLPSQFGQSSGRSWALALLLLSALLALVVVAECGTVHLDHPQFRIARLALNLATYAAAFALYVTIYGAQWRSLISSTAIILVTFPLALELLRSTEAQLGTSWLHAAIIAVVVGQISWPLNALGLRSLYGGAFLLLAFYTLCGVSQQHLAGRLSRRVVLEFIGLATIFALVVTLSAVTQQRRAQARFPLGIDPAQVSSPDYHPPDGPIRSGPELDSNTGTD